ncbi:hypothetical protein HDU82_004672 [Entophlyctis luteolus]|nr:hypothetical protein HDU82_004672 [Entophlyctis luteolus]
MDRVILIEPETAKFYPRTGSLTSMLLTSSKALKKIIDCVGNTPAYIVSGEIGNSEIRWVFKINNYSDQAGIAYWDISNISLKSDSPDELEAKLLASILSHGKLVNAPGFNNGRLASKSSKRNKTSLMDEFLLKLRINGGAVQAAPPVIYENSSMIEDRVNTQFPTRFPSVHMLIGPSCTTPEATELVCTSDTICIEPYRMWGTVMPQQTCESDELTNAAESLVEGLLHIGYWGYVTVEFIAWDNHDTGVRHLWCIGVKPYLSVALSSCLNFLMATCTKPMQPGYYKAGSTMLDLNQSRKIVFKYLHENKYIDLDRAKRAANMATFDGDEDLVERVGVYSPWFQHVGFMSLTTTGIEALCLDSGFNMDLKEVATTIIPELRRSRRREALFGKNGNLSTTIVAHDPELYPVQWKFSTERLLAGKKHSIETTADGFEFEINIEKADSLSNSCELSHTQLARPPSSVVSADDISMLGFSRDGLSPIMNVSTENLRNSDLNLFVGGADTTTVSILTSTENTHISKRLAANRLEEVIVLSRAVDLPDYAALGIQDFSPLQRVKLITANKNKNEKPMPAIMPDPKSISLLNSLIPSNSLWAKYEDYGEIEEYEPMHLNEIRDRIPLGLPPEEYLELREENRRKRLLEEQRALAELSDLIAREKEAWMASGKPMSKKVMDDIESAARRHFFDQQDRFKKTPDDAEINISTDKPRMRLRDFMGKHIRYTVGDKRKADSTKDGEEGRSGDFENGSLETITTTSIMGRELQTSIFVPSLVMRDIGEAFLGLRGTTVVGRKAESSDSDEDGRREGF